MTQALYNGPLEQNGTFLDESQVTSHVANNASYWQYIDACKRGGREIGTSEGGIFSWRLSIQFLDQSGAAAVLEDGKTTLLTPESHEFYRLSGAEETKETSVAILTQSIDKMVSAHVKLIADLGANLSDNVQKAVSVAVNATMAPFSDLSARVAQLSKDESGRADEMTKVAFKLMREMQPKPDVFDGIAKVAPAAVMGLKALKDLKN